VYHAGLTTRYRKDSLHVKNIFLLPSSRNILFVKRIERLLHSASKKYEFVNLEIRFHKHKVSFLVVKTVKCNLFVLFQAAADNISHHGYTTFTAHAIRYSVDDNFIPSERFNDTCNRKVIIVITDGRYERNICSCIVFVKNGRKYLIDINIIILLLSATATYYLLRKYRIFHY